MELYKEITELTERHPSRYTREEKTEFLLDAKKLLKDAGYAPGQITEQRLRDIFNSRNLIVGNENAEYIITAHYDTPGRNGFLLGTSSLLGQTGANIVMMLLSLPFFAVEALLMSRVLEQDDPSGLSVAFAMFAMPLLLIAATIIPMLIRNRNNRNDNTSGAQCVLQCAVYAASHPELLEKCCFVLFDNEEWGLAGSTGFASRLKKRGVEPKDHFVINLDCVGVGEVLAAVCAAKAGERYGMLIDKLKASGLTVEEKRSELVFMSDHAAFPDSVMLAYMNRSKLGPLYIPNIHSEKDTECDPRLVAGLAEQLVDFLGTR